MQVVDFCELGWLLQFTTDFDISRIYGNHFAISLYPNYAIKCTRVYLWDLRQTASWSTWRNLWFMASKLTENMQFTVIRILILWLTFLHFGFGRCWKKNHFIKLCISYAIPLFKSASFFNEMYRWVCGGSTGHYSS